MSDVHGTGGFARDRSKALKRQVRTDTLCGATVSAEALTAADEKKSGLISPLKTTRYGVSARRPMKESMDRACSAGHRQRLQHRCPQRDSISTSGWRHPSANRTHLC
ncbi:hypothetical protein C0Z19_21990 [Trinickia soli]|uniref:Uncharacterized protein n=1 Tax=Trinickia soli TaxID=380675 RepID=A0A2N7VP40_9BURK|nr:hypothetical protein C0Z19_21990 [Trinickia soli]